MTAPMVLDGPMNATAFQAYADQVLVPTLKPGDIVVMDNLPAHNVRRQIEEIRSPDFNPIEMAFAKLKAILKKAAARTAPEYPPKVLRCAAARRCRSRPVGHPREQRRAAYSAKAAG